jgi:diguanylate cyclase (GGDEF)-like protein
MKRKKSQQVPNADRRLEISDTSDPDRHADELTNLLKVNRELSNIADELTNLLKVNRELSNILNPDDLYVSFANLIKEKFNLRNIAIFVYQEISLTFDLVYSHGQNQSDLSFKKDESLLWQTIVQQQPFAVFDESGNPIFPEIFNKYGLNKLKADWWIPLVMRDEVVGVLAISHQDKSKQFSDLDLFILKQITSHAAICINTCRLYEKRQKEKEELDKILANLSLLYSIGKAMNYISDLKSLLQYILSQAVEITAAEKGSIMLYDLESDRLMIRVLAGMADTAYQEKVNNNEIKCRTFKPGEGIAGRVYLTAKPMVVNNIRDDDLFVESESSYVSSIACIPMVVYNDVIGVINVTNKRGEKDFSDEDVQMLKAVADQAAVAVNKAQLWDMAVTDSLTGLYVRRYFMVKFQEELHRADRYNKILSIVMADIDRFKKINDTYGHDVGDKVLQTIGKFFQKNIRDVDIIARYGGEEFIVMIPEADREAAYCMAERLREKFSEIDLGELPNITISLGIAAYPDDGTEIEDLLKKADAAMYAAKQAGRNKVMKYSKDIKLIREKAPVN